MPLQKIYDAASVKAAIERAEGHHFSSFSSVYGATDYDWGVQEFRDKKGVVRHTRPVFKGPKEAVSADVGHTLRNHVKGKQASNYVGEKSRYNDLFTCIQATRELLNSPTGQAKLKELDGDNVNVDRKIQADLAGHWYGDNSDGSTKKITRATCIVMKLGPDTLWIHTSYPTKFIE
jgi:hypothetical protein